MHTTIINDCRDDNAAARQTARASTLIGGTTSFVGVARDLEAAGNLIDVLDAVEDRESVVLVNVAPRDGKAKKWKNGTPFGYFRYKNTLVVASIDGLTLSLVKKLGLADEIAVLDIDTTLDALVAAEVLTREHSEALKTTQFRSFDFVPRAAAALARGIALPFEAQPIAEVLDAPRAVWWVDNFGNCKTTLFEHECEELKEPFSLLPRYERLKDVEDGEVALITGSSGIEERRFVEIVCQGGSAAEKLNLGVGRCIS